MEEEVALVSTDEAVAEVRRWLEVDRVDPERVFTASGDQVIRYKDLIRHLEEGTPDGELLRFAISRGRTMRRERGQPFQRLMQIGPRVDAAPAPGSSEDPDAET